MQALGADVIMMIVAVDAAAAVAPAMHGRGVAVKVVGVQAL